MQEIVLLYLFIKEVILTKFPLQMQVQVHKFAE